MLVLVSFIGFSVARADEANLETKPEVKKESKVEILFDGEPMDNDRHVINGTIIYNGYALALSASEAQFAADQGGVEEIVQECGMVDREIRIYKRTIEPRSTDPKRGYKASAQVGIPFEDCETAKRSANDPAKKKARQNPILARDQELFAKMMRDDQAKDPTVRAELAKHLKNYDSKSDGRMKKTDAKLAEQDRKIAQLERRLEKQAKPAEEPAQNYVSAPPAAPSACKEQYSELMTQASSAAQYNNPPGNLTQGVALAFYNKAMSVRGRCPAFAQQDAAQQRAIASRYPEVADIQDQANRIVKMQADICWQNIEIGRQITHGEEVPLLVQAVNECKAKFGVK